MSETKKGFYEKIVKNTNKNSRRYKKSKKFESNFLIIYIAQDISLNTSLGITNLSKLFHAHLNLNNLGAKSLKGGFGK